MHEAEEGWLQEVSSIREEAERFAAEKDGEQSAAFKALSRQLRRYREEYLLSELVRRTFLPGYGFPTDVVSFIPTTIADIRREAGRDNQREEAYGTRQGFPSRQGPVAIRDYAPGADVVIDGKVFTSGGVTLNWHIPAGATDVTELQAFSIAWRCGSCGATGTNPMLPTFCEVCDADETHLHTRQFLAPAGFAVDIRYQPHNDVSTPTYLAPNDPWVSCPTNEWVGLPNPELGRFRFSERGHLFYWNAGTNGRGYAVCLRCGRAEPDTTNPLPNHARLRGGRHPDGTSICATPTHTHDLAVPAEAESAANASWGLVLSGAILIRRRRESGEAVSEPQDIVATNDLRPRPENTVAEIRLKDELNGKLENFGHGFWSALVGRTPALGELMSSDQFIERVIYHDRYLHSPWSLLLLREVICGLVSCVETISSKTVLEVVTRPLPKRTHPIGPSISTHNWDMADDGRRRSFMEQCVDIIPNAQSWPGRVKFSTNNNAPHSRELIVEWSSGQRWSIHVDQGFGYWRPQIQQSFPFNDSEKDQVKWANINRSRSVVASSDETHPTIVYVVRR